MEPGDAVHQPVAQQGGGDLGPALDQQAGDAGVGQGGEAGAQVDAGLAARDFVQHGAEFGEGVGRSGSEPARTSIQSGRVVRRRHQPGAQRGAQMRVGDDADDGGGAEAGDAAGEVGVVGEHGADADHDRVVPAAQGVGHAARGLGGDPAAFAAMRGDAAVERGGELQRHQRAALCQTQDEAGGDLGGLVLQHALLHGDAGGAQAGEPGAVHARIGVAQGDDDAGDAGLDQRVGAGRGAAPVGAGFEGDVGGRASGGRAGRCRGRRFRRAAGRRGR